MAARVWTSGQGSVGRQADRFLAGMVAAGRHAPGRDVGGKSSASPAAIEELLAADLISRRSDGTIEVTAAGRARAARLAAANSGTGVDPFIAQHVALARRNVEGPHGRAGATLNDAESPLAWLARRKGRDGQPLIAPIQLLAGERLRMDFTRAQLMPRVTSNWQAAISQGARNAAGGLAANMTDVMVASRQRVTRALDAVGPEFAGFLVDVCCFLKGLEDVERERRWPLRSAKVVLQLGLDRLARHYGLAASARGKARAEVRAWLAPDAELVVES